jgi:hypothetical protein
MVDGDEIAWKAGELGDVGEKAGKLGGRIQVAEVVVDTAGAGRSSGHRL